jgi:hypothetical protein
MKAPPDQLQESFIWDAQGHLTEPAVTALADGELSLLSEAALAHADSCARCADRIGHSALMALALSDALSVGSLQSELHRTPASAPPAALASHSVPSARAARRPLPFGLLAGALLIAALGSLPNLARLWELLFRMPELAARALPVLARVVVLVGHRVTNSEALSALRWFSAASLVCAGIAIARLGPPAVRRPLEKGAS